MHKINKQPWPTKQAMQQVYEKQLWGAMKTPFYSGEGSHNTTIVSPYIEVVKIFLQQLKTPPVICDLGCGDFNIGKKLLSNCDNYIGVDIVPELVEHLNRKYAIKNTNFLCRDIAKDPLPQAEVALVRQVLQHLSNIEISTILKKLPQYKYVIITDHIPVGDFEPNIDIISGQGIRLKKKSGLVVEKAPFYFEFKKSQILSEIFLDEKKGIIRTTLYIMY